MAGPNQARHGLAGLLGLVGLFGGVGARGEMFVWSGDVDGHYAFTQAAYTTREISLSSDLTLPLPSSELDGEFRFDRDTSRSKVRRWRSTPTSTTRF